MGLIYYIPAVAASYSWTMAATYDLEGLKTQWNQVLDLLLERNRIAWLAFFDARLAAIEESSLTLNFADSKKLGGEHDFTAQRNPRHTEELQACIAEVTGLHLDIIEA